LDGLSPPPPPLEDEAGCTTAPGVGSRLARTGCGCCCCGEAEGTGVGACELPEATAGGWKDAGSGKPPGGCDGEALAQAPGGGAEDEGMVVPQGG